MGEEDCQVTRVDIDAPAKFTLAVCRRFSIGATIHSPTLNGISFELSVGPFMIQFWNRGRRWFRCANYWNG